MNAASAQSDRKLIFNRHRCLAFNNRFSPTGRWKNAWTWSWRSWYFCMRRYAINLWQPALFSDGSFDRTAYFALKRRTKRNRFWKTAAGWGRPRIDTTGHRNRGKCSSFCRLAINIFSKSGISRLNWMKAICQHQLASPEDQPTYDDNIDLFLPESKSITVDLTPDMMVERYPSKTVICWRLWKEYRHL